MSSGVAIDRAYLIASVLFKIRTYSPPDFFSPTSISSRILLGSSVRIWSEVSIVKSASFPEISPIIGRFLESLSPPTPQVQITLPLV